MTLERLKTKLEQYRYVESVGQTEHGWIHVSIDAAATEYDANAITGLMVQHGYKPKLLAVKGSYHFAFRKDKKGPIGSYMER